MRFSPTPRWEPEPEPKLEPKPPLRQPTEAPRLSRLLDPFDQVDEPLRDAPGRFVADLAKQGFEALVWKGLEVVVDTLTPGAGTMVKTLRLTVGSVRAVESFVDGRGVALKVPVLCHQDTGFSLGMRTTIAGPPGSAGPRDTPSPRDTARPGDQAEQPPEQPSPVGWYVGWDPFDPAKPGELSVEAVVDERTLKHGWVVTAPRAEVRAATRSSVVDAAALKTFLQKLTGVRDEEYAITYLDPDTRVGLLAIVEPGRSPYCPLLFEAGEQVRMWQVPVSPTAAPPQNPAKPWWLVTTPESAEPHGPGSPEPSVPQAPHGPGSPFDAMLDELGDRFGLPPGELVRAALVAHVAASAALAAQREFGVGAAPRLHAMGAHATASLLAAAERLSGAAPSERSTRLAVQRIAVWSTTASSAHAAQWRALFASILGDARTIAEALASISDEALLEAAIEELETLAGEPNQLRLALEKHFGERERERHPDG